MKFIRFALVFFALFHVISCSKEGAEKESLIDPANSNLLSAALSMPAGTVSRSGNPPSPSTSGAATVVPLTPSTTSSNGSTTPVVFNYQNGTNNLAGVLVQVDGANTYFDIPLSGPTAGQITLPIGLPTNLDEGEFWLLYCTYDINNLISNVGELRVNVLRLGTGALQISLSWNTATDQDLHVNDPSNTTIYYANPVSGTGGELDYDNTSGYGPENIFWKSNAPDGTYTVSVDDYSGTGVATTCFVTITAPGVSKTYQVTTQNGNFVNVVTFTKSGSTFSF